MKEPAQIKVGPSGLHGAGLHNIVACRKTFPLIFVRCDALVGLFSSGFVAEVESIHS